MSTQTDELTFSGAHVVSQNELKFGAVTIGPSVPRTKTLIPPKRNQEVQRTLMLVKKDPFAPLPLPPPPPPPKAAKPPPHNFIPTFFQLQEAAAAKPPPTTL
jgi:hypothetical protein